MSQDSDQALAVLSDLDGSPINRVYQHRFAWDGALARRTGMSGLSEIVYPASCIEQFGFNAIDPIWAFSAE
jgi:hypothetical protein